MKHIIPNVSVKNCSEAIQYYKKIFGGEIKNLQIGDDNPMFKYLEGKVIHSELHVNENCILYFSDILNENNPCTSPSLVLQLQSEREIRKIYSAFRKDGTVIFKLQKTFWGALHGVVIDKFDLTWSLNYISL
jgi:PhnB protein